MNPGQYIYALTLALVGLGCWLYGSRSEHEPECRRWLAACLLMAAGLSLEISSMALPHWSMSLAMLLLIGGALLQLSVLSRLAPSSLPSWLWIGILILGVGGEILPGLSPLPRHLGMSLTALAFGLCFGLEAWQFWRLERQLGKRYPGPLPVIGALAALCFVLRIITLLTHDERYSELGENVLYLLASTANIYNSMGLQIVLLQHSNHALGHLALHDALTGALNRRGLQEQLAQLRKSATPQVCIALLDIDHFKRINDLHGHAAGDEILRQLVFFLQKSLRSSDRVARYGGEEFCLLLSGMSPGTAQQRIDQIRATFASHSALSTAPEFRCSFSAGVCQWQNSLSDAGNFSRADDLLYQAKNAGRNCVVGQSANAA